jgi:hypothetical protein
LLQPHDALLQRCQRPGDPRREGSGLGLLRRRRWPLRQRWWLLHWLRSPGLLGLQLLGQRVVGSRSLERLLLCLGLLPVEGILQLPGHDLV